MGQQIRTSAKWHTHVLVSILKERRGQGAYLVVPQYSEAQSGCCRFQIVLVNIRLMLRKEKKKKA